MGKIYLAAPFFNEEQETTIGTVEAMCRELGWDFFSPRLECFCPPNAKKEIRSKTFNTNLDSIDNASFVLARTDDYDPGTMTEIGYAFRKKPIVAYTTFERDRGLNLMLAEGCVGFLQGLTRLRNFLKGSRVHSIIERQMTPDHYFIKNKNGKYLNWELVKEWQKEII